MSTFGRLVDRLDRWGDRHGLSRDSSEVVPAKVLIRRVLTPPLIWYLLAGIAIAALLATELSFDVVVFVLPTEVSLLLVRAGQLERRNRT